MRILIAYDGSECARAALTDLRFAGLPSDAEVLVLSVLDAWLPAEDGPGGKADEVLPALSNIRASVRAAVGVGGRQRGVAEDGAARLRALFPGWSVKAEASADSPAWAIIRRAEGNEGGVGGWGGKPADLVVVGSHGYGGLRRLVLGSVSHRVVTELRCSVRISRGSGGHDAVKAAGHERAPNIVVGVDGSADSRAAVDAVASRRWPGGTRILVATFEQGIDAVSGFAGSGGAYSVWGGDPREHAAPASPPSGESPGGWGVRIVEEAAATLRRQCPRASVSTVVKAGDPKHALIGLAEGWKEDGTGGAGGADCIFVGAKGVRGLGRFLLGSVSTAVAMNAHCSVEIVHPRRAPG